MIYGIDIFSEASLLGIAAFLSAIGGLITNIWTVRKGRREERETAEEDCRRRLKEAREEAERVADELHKQRMRRARDAS
jgi:hypothetical protein